MPSLMDLPQEIRAMIFEEVINGHRIPPKYPSESNMLRASDVPRTLPMELYHEKRDTHSLSNCLSLLLTNRQVSVETQSVLNRMKKTTYILDLSVLNEMHMFSTWISVPRLTTRLSTLHIDMRFFGRIVTSKEALYSGSTTFSLNHCFYRYLDRFLTYGPVGRKDGREDSYEDEDRGIIVENLVLDFHSAETELPFPPGHMSYEDWEAKRCGNPRCDDEQMDEVLKYKTRPQWPLSAMRLWLAFITKMGYGVEDYGSILYESIGTISLLLNGRLETAFDLADQLAEVPNEMYDRYSNFNVPKFQKWRERTLSRREAVGLRTVQPRDLWSR
ncbi:uncharacterized protein N7518_002430 [Penicillium psychrosexuale]|uniref:uncharacterized protein n=1 Tax=Penicillium psychrosexuale TaxID=1002107 RepID=UPI002544F8CF|nr:uncharacterized protein N7518_002430 [Penicillium psychrosexuale]KAJ5800362.1 hypothetical protein N7518_002430 [Penicillium psychrosexuale]